MHEEEEEETAAGLRRSGLQIGAPHIHASPCMHEEEEDNVAKEMGSSSGVSVSHASPSGRAAC